MNSKDAVYNIEDYKAGITYSTITNMRNIVGNMTLDEVLSGRDKINSKLLEQIDEITDAYGIKILSVEIKKYRSTKRNTRSHGKTNESRKR